MKELTVSAIIPVHNGCQHLERCFKALAASEEGPQEIILVDDGSTDEAAELGSLFGATVLRIPKRGGPARARNLGARAARGDLLLFLDADVYVHPDAIKLARQQFEADPELSALFGSYDDSPPAGNFVSQYKNLLHCFVHRTSRRDATAFWTGCGMIRREVFLAHGGFNESYGRPSIEDIELGYRLRRSGAKIVLDPRVRATHGKKWTFAGLLRTDIFDRAIPWAELILREGRMPDDLNIRLEQRLSLVLTYLALLAAFCALCTEGTARALAIGTTLGLLIVIARLNADFHQFLKELRGPTFVLRAFAMQLLSYVYSGLAFGAGLLRALWRRT